MQTRPRPTATLHAKVKKIIKPRINNEPEKAEIVLDEGDPFYREIRIENRLKNSDGEEVALKPGSPVEVTVEADQQFTEAVTQNNKAAKLAALSLNVPRP